MAKRSVLQDLLLRVMPILVLVSLVFFGILVRQEWQNQLNTQRQVAQLNTHSLSILLREPLWQFSDVIVRNVLQIGLEQGAHCLSVYDEVKQLIYQVGLCAQNQALESFSSPIFYNLREQERTIGKLVAEVAIEVDEAYLLSQLFILGILAILLLLSMAIAIYVAMRAVVLKPLTKVGDSLHHYRQTNSYQRVDWQSNNELGEFIQLYNQSIELQAGYQNQLERERNNAQAALRELKSTQTKLLQSEKMASLGSIVAGIAHEINTPIGNSLTVASTLEEKHHQFAKSMAQGITKSKLERFLADVEEASAILTRSLGMAAEQVANFKQVAVDQTSDQKRSFDLAILAHEVLSTLKPSIKHKNIELVVDIDPNIIMNSYPGPLGQIISNCFTNAVLHGLNNEGPGQITLCGWALNAHEVMLTVTDSGQGLAEHLLTKAMDPFFTTKLGQGGSGLGLHLVYQLTHGLLKGEVHLSNQAGQGLKVELRLPKDPEQ